ELPLPQGVLNTCLESSFLFLVADLEPEFDQLDPVLNNVLFTLWAQVEATLILLRRAEPQDMLDAIAVVATAVKNDDLTGRRQMRYIALHIHLALLSVRGRLQSHDAEDPGADAFSDRLDGAALAGGVTPFEDDGDPQALIFHPFLELAEFRLQPLQFLFVGLALHLGCTVVICFVCHARSPYEEMLEKEMPLTCSLLP